MSLPRPRLTIRRLMIAVAVVAVGLGAGVELKQRRDRFATLCAHHSARAVYVEGGSSAGGAGRPIKVNAYHLKMKRKYEYAYSHPWLPVPPDPPEHK